MDGPVRAAGERLANHLRRTRWPGGYDHDFAAVLLLQAQRLFERVGVRLVQLEAGILIANPGLRLVDAQLPLAGDDLFDTDCYFHYLMLVSSYQLPVSSEFPVREKTGD